jgi:predicted dinucleotide-utilizing enzyme
VRTAILETDESTRSQNTEYSLSFGSGGFRRCGEADAVTQTVDLVVSGDNSAALAEAVRALQSGRRVLVVLQSGGASAGQRFRRRLRRAANAEGGRLAVMTNAEVVCVDGLDGVEAVVIRQSRTGRLYAVNPSAFLSCNGSMCSAFAGRGGNSRKEDNPI